MQAGVAGMLQKPRPDAHHDHGRPAKDGWPRPRPDRRSDLLTRIADLQALTGLELAGAVLDWAAASWDRISPTAASGRLSGGSNSCGKSRSRPTGGTFPREPTRSTSVSGFQAPGGEGERVDKGTVQPLHLVSGSTRSSRHHGPAGVRARSRTRTSQVPEQTPRRQPASSSRCPVVRPPGLPPVGPQVRVPARRGAPCRRSADQ